MPLKPIAHPKWLRSVSLHESQPARRTLITSLFMAGYALSVSYCVASAGEPYAAALIERDRLEAANNASNLTAAPDEQYKPPLSPPAERLPSTPPEPVDPPPSNASNGDGTGPPSNASNESNGNGTEGFTPTPRPLPHEWLPNATACALLFLLATAHALFHLMCHWSVDFKTRALFSPASSVRPGCYLCFKPLPHKGRPAIVMATRSSLMQKLTCEFQRQKFEVLPAEELRGREDAGELVGLQGAEVGVALIRCPDSLPRAVYHASVGLVSEAEVKVRAEQFGDNLLSVPTPRFLDLYIEQLLSPLAMFQIFTSVLWLLDSISIGFSVFEVIAMNPLYSIPASSIPPPPLYP